MHGLSTVNGVPGNDEAKEDIHACTARALALLGAFKESARHHHKSIYHRLKYIGKPDIAVTRKYGTIGSHFLQINQRDSSLVNFRRAEKLLRSLNYPILHASSWNNLGLAYARFGQPDSALICYNNGLNILNRGTDGNDPFNYVILENKAEIEVLQGNPDAAIELLKECIDYRTVGNPKYVESLYKNYQRLIELKVATGQTQDIAFDCSQFFNSLKYEKKRPVQKFKSILSVLDVEIAFGLKSELFAKSLRLIYADSLINELESQNQARIMVMSDYERSILSQQKEIGRLESERKRQDFEFAQNQTSQKITYLIGLAMILLIGAAMIWIIFKKKSERFLFEKQMSELALENQKLSEQKLAQELEQKKGDLMDLAIYNTKKQEWSNEVLSKLKSLRGKEERELHKMIRQLELDMGLQKSTESKMNVVHSNIEKVNNEFYNKLSELYPDLTRGERELCGYLRLRLSGKEIAQIRNVSPQAVTKAKQRLRKKIELGTDGDLYAYFEAI